jgi:hypothetical protein
MRYILMKSSNSAWDAFLACNVVSEGICSSNSFVYCAILFSPRDFP